MSSFIPSRRRPGRKPQPLNASDASSLDSLYDGLIRSLEEAGEPIADEHEFFEFVRAWAVAHSGKNFPILDPSFPTAIQRRQALQLVTAFNLEGWLRFFSAAAEDVGDSFDPELEHGAWLDWRNELVGRHRLEGLIPSQESQAQQFDDSQKPKRRVVLWDRIPDGDDFDD